MIRGQRFDFEDIECGGSHMPGMKPSDAEPDPITTPDELKARLEMIRGKFYDIAVNRSPYRLTGISAPMFDHNNDAVATVGLLSGLDHPGGESVADQAKLVCACAKKVSDALGSSRWPRQAD